jgi:sugar phosphate isomerase/epimerase
MPLNRRDFLQKSGAGVLMGSVQAWNKPAAPVTASDGYQLMIMGTNWGFPGSITEFCQKAREAGYDGIEIWMPGDDTSRAELAKAAGENKLALGLLYGGGDADPVLHAQQFSNGLQQAAAMKPIYINCHSGRDYFSFDQNRAMMDESYQLSAKTGIPVYHETHRGRSLFAAHITRQFLEKIPNLRLTFDVSHWCNVHESLLGDQPDTMSVTLPRVDHIHARIGHAEGPQVNDPRAPEWEQAVKVHLGWWDQVVARKKQEGKRMTILTEFGPPDYLPTLPYTRQPLASQWDINVYMMQLLRKRYQS